jgi:hypothetical protein
MYSMHPPGMNLEFVILINKRMYGTCSQVSYERELLASWSLWEEESI